ncbi:protoporphyrinogen oxidase [Motiliproteus sediminis]|uniref:protoporphyrinogen oxidase n=1 Tax=Motiliproteus sediminis TaxID=1468178 RepID=UPI001AEFC3A8|nr:protoporphyrinogen oxidase [Motiliproteus sediminis]
MSRSFLVIGAGISGLCTAWFLKQRGHSVTLLETRDQAGGNIRTLHQDGYLIERGPNSTLNSRPALATLFESLGISPLEANKSSKKRYVLRDGSLHPLPMGPGDFIRTPLFSGAGKWRLLAEPFIGRAKEEESVARFVERRLGQEFLNWAINPFVSGVYAGDPEQLSARAATAKVYALEKEYGSLMRGALAKILFHRHKGGAGPAGSMISFDAGMQVMTDTLGDRLGDALCTGVSVDILEQTADGWCARAGEQQWSAEEVVLALPAKACAQLLEPLLPALPELFDAIPYPAVASVSLGFRKSQVAHPLDGFGFLIPRITGVETLGVLFPSSVFPNRAPEGHCLLTAFIGGTLNPELADLGDDEVTRRVLRDIRPLLGIEGEPAVISVNRWREAIPQYTLGHLERLASIDGLLKSLPGLHTRANWREGISVADCVQNAFDFAQRQGV